MTLLEGSLFILVVLSPFWMVFLGALIHDFFSCKHDWERIPGNLMFEHRQYKCKKCGKHETKSTKWSREPWRDW